MNKARKVHGLAPLPLRPEDTTPASAAPEFVDVHTVRLKTDHQRAFFWLAQAAAADHVDAQVALGNLCMRLEPQPDVRQAVVWYSLAACQPIPPGIDAAITGLPAEDAQVQPEHMPHPDALYNLGMLYYEGMEPHLPQNRRQAVALFELAAEQFDPTAMFWLGMAHHVGDETAGVRRIGSRARRFIELAASQGHAGAMHYLANLHRTGDPVLGLSVDLPKCRHFLQEAAELDHADACFDLADALLHGKDGFTADATRALHYYERAGAEGHADALLCAGVLYFRGQGTPQNYTLALQRYQAAGEAGNIEGWRNVAAMYAAGTGVQQRLDIARHIRDNVIAVMERAAQAATPVESAPAVDHSKGACGKPECAGGVCASTKSA